MRERIYMAIGAGDKARDGTRRWPIDLGVLAVIGLLMGFLGPFGSDKISLGARYLYWQACIVGGGGIGLAADAASARVWPHPWSRLAVVSVLATPAVTLFVLTTQAVMFRDDIAWSRYLSLLWQVWPILAAVLVVRALMWRRGAVRTETRTVTAPPLPEAEAAFRRRLSARRRQARLIAVEAHDHYLKVHTDVGDELVTMRFADALAELERAHGWRVHRSWWVSADAVEAVRWRRGGGEARLVGGLTAPVSRTHAALLKQAGWF